MNESQKIPCCFLITCGDAAKMLAATDKAFHQVAATILASQQASGYGASSPRGDHRRAATEPNIPEPRVAVIAFVRDQVTRLVVGQQMGGLRHIMVLSGCNDQVHRLAGRFDGDVQLGAKTATRTPEGFIGPPFFIAPAACWWARMTVESSIRHSKSGSCQTFNSRSQTPCLDQRWKRWNTEFQSPKRSGRSRHGAPVRATHKTALMNLRLSWAVRPGSEDLPGSSSLIRSHCSTSYRHKTLGKVWRERERRGFRPGRQMRAGDDRRRPRCSSQMRR